MHIAKKWIYAKPFVDEPTLDNFQLVEEPVPELKDGEFMIRAHYLSVDPYMRIYMLASPTGSTMIGGQVGQVIESKHADFPVGAYAFAQVGWRTVSVCDPAKFETRKPYVLPELGSLPVSLGMGALGTVGNTAYFGLLEICQPKEGETVVVSGAAGAVGSIVGQIAKIKGCRVIGIAGTVEKCEWLREIGFDGAINYKEENIEQALRQLAPDGVDCYFDNVGGRTSELVQGQMKQFGRIAVCGTISMYNASEPTRVADPQLTFVWKQLVQEGFSVHRWTDRWFEGVHQNLQWIQEGKIKVRETITEGFENMPRAFIEMMKGGNVGKAVLIRRRYSTGTTVARKWIYAKTFKGEPNHGNFRLETEPLPTTLQKGEFLAEAEYLSVDPYMRPYMLAYPEGSLMIGGQIARVTRSENDHFPVGASVFGQFGWRTHTVCDPDRLEKDKPYVLPDFGTLPKSLGLGILGMPGNTAYFGLQELCQPKPGETVVVSGAAGAVGSVVGQIAKIKGCRAIGIAGSEEKCAWLRKIGFDGAINYKRNDVYGELKQAAPKGVDCYFDNVGGSVTETVLKQMNVYGRIAVCGAISNYNSAVGKVTDPQRQFVFKQLRMEGFLVWRWNDRWLEGIEGNLRWIREGRLVYEETITEGFERTPDAFIDMLRGGNTGKAVVKVRPRTKMVLARKWMYVKRPEGEPKVTDFSIKEEELPALEAGDFLVETEYFSLDAGLRGYMELGALPVGSPVVGMTLAKVIESKNDKFPVGVVVCARLGWATHAVFNQQKQKELQPYIVPHVEGHSRAIGLGPLGLSGNTAYFGFLEICKPKRGETVVVSAAAGAVGSLVGQIAKLKGCHVVGLAGTEEKCAWLREIGFDAVINYRVGSVREQLAELTPRGVDCYFDNVGGELTELVRERMNLYGRISVCGAVSSYNGKPASVMDPQRDFVSKQLRQEGFVVFRWLSRWMEGIEQMREWLEQGKLVHRETVYEGFETAPNSFINMLRGDNIGKAVLKV
uniref:Prostaglandin reductase 1 n=1 Tax=Anopheles christyi TaxID=43041 RepID=A0A182K2Y6_9DIPT